jgi:hypothetical protein
MKIIQLPFVSPNFIVNMQKETLFSPSFQNHIMWRELKCNALFILLITTSDKIIRTGNSRNHIIFLLRGQTQAQCLSRMMMHPT